MSIPTILLFLAYAWGLGFSATIFLREWGRENFWERNLMRLGIGLASFVVLGALLSLFRIPIDWRIFLLLSLVVPSIILVKDKARAFSGLDLRLTKTNLMILGAVAIFAVSFYMYASGAFAYPWLEDDDPWVHALGAKYISIEKTIHKTPQYGFQYLDPYPPGYDMLMGVLHQTNSSVSWTLKFFNALIISLSLIFFFFFAKEFLQSAPRALFSTLALAAMPSFLTHFIWATALSIALFFVAFYCASKSIRDKKWILPASISVAAVLLTQPSTAFIFGFIFGIYWFIKSVLDRKFNTSLFAAGLLGIVISVVAWWGSLFFRFGGFFPLIKGLGVTEDVGLTSFQVIGTATRLYGFRDFFLTESPLINNPTGIGPVLTILGLLALLIVAISFRQDLKSRHYIVIAAAWLAFTFIGLNGARLPVNFFAFRFWMLFAFSLALLLPEAAWFIGGMLRRFRIPLVATIMVLSALIIWTSFLPKYQLNTSVWPPGARFVYLQDNPPEEIDGYAWLRTLPDNTRVIAFEDDAITTGFDKFVCGWCPEVIDFKKKAYDLTAGEIAAWMRDNDYEYITFGSQELGKAGPERLDKLLSEMLQPASGLFSIAHQNRIVKILRLKAS